MSETKVKEPTLRDQMVEEVGLALLEQFGLGEMPVTKEGFLVEAEGKHFVVKVIQKKNPVPQEDVRDLFVAEDTDAEDADAEDLEDEVEDEEEMEMETVSEAV